jgi:hypothetical protein
LAVRRTGSPACAAMTTYSGGSAVGHHVMPKKMSETQHH